MLAGKPNVSVMCCDSPNLGLVVPTMSLGGHGTANMTGNIAPAELATISTPWTSYREAEGFKNAYLKLLPLLHFTYSAINPVAVKSLMKAVGLPAGDLRKPLTNLEGEALAKGIRIVQELGLDKRYGYNVKPLVGGRCLNQGSSNHGSRYPRPQGAAERREPRTGQGLRHGARPGGRRRHHRGAHPRRAGTHLRGDPRRDRRQGDAGGGRHHHGAGTRRRARGLSRARHPAQQRRRPAARRFPRLDARRLDRRARHDDAGHIEMMRLTVDGMMERGFGRIVNIVSRSVKMPQLELGLSNGARSGLVGFVAGLARQTVARNVTINNLLPGIFDSDAQRRHIEGMLETSGKSFEQIWRERAAANPAKRYGGPAELGAYCAFLCSAHAGFITGQNLVIDGGSYPGTF